MKPKKQEKPEEEEEEEEEQEKGDEDEEGMEEETQPRIEYDEVRVVYLDDSCRERWRRGIAHGLNLLELSGCVDIIITIVTILVTAYLII